MARTSARDFYLAIDTGGTFTDCVWVEQGRLRMLKVFTTPADPSQAILQALQQIGNTAPLTLLHGTTVGTNTVLQRKGAKVALVTTRGFEDAIEIGRQARPKLYDFFFDRIEPLVSSGMRFGVTERTASTGEILQPPADVPALVRSVAANRPEAIAVCFLFSFANPRNENVIAAALEELALPLSISHQILPEFREYERMSTAVVNAYLQPVMTNYLRNLERRARETGKQRPRIFVMQSTGGITSLSTAAREPVRTVLSGPAGGVVGAARMARRSGFARVITFDMGGTSTDVALVDGDIAAGSQSEIAGLPVGVPMLDIHTVGAGGGSLARFDAAGALRVGPESAGSDPGPICYGRGTEPTVTDANLLLGRLQPHRFLGGDFTLDLDRTRKIVREWLKKQESDLSLERFAAGVIRVVNATMEKAIRVVSIERGYDTRDFALVAFGGAGGLHACELAQGLGIPRVIIPALPGALSAFGILVSDVVKDYSRTVLLRIQDKLPIAHLEKEFAVLSARAKKDLKQEEWSGAIRLQRTADVRYRGQGYELNVPYTPRLPQHFRDQHMRRYGYGYPGRELEIVTLRLRATMNSQSPIGKIDLQRRAEPVQTAPVYFEGKSTKAAIYDRSSLEPARKYRGPAVITEYSATTVVPKGMKFTLDRTGNLHVTVH
ncbi:MAG TPA: hydantoinase/oxoprolinase family protein [Terriglobales bacterium]|nr:hydantoinase/oxoprolinase family protein [Terriglobales bacterium]